MRLPLASDLKSRDGTTTRDAGSKNAIIETSGESSALLKRPGALALGGVGVGEGQLLACYNNELRAIVGNTLADISITSGIEYGNNYALPTSSGHTWTSIAFGNGIFLAKEQSGETCAISSDGKTWSAGSDVSFVSDGIWDSMAFGAGIFVAMTFNDSGDRYATTPDGITWTTRTFPANLNASALRFLNGLFVLGNSSGGVYTSPDGINWTAQTLAGYPGGSPVAKDFTFGAGIYAMYGFSSTSPASRYVSKTADFVTWTHTLVPYACENIVYDGAFILPGSAYSYDCVTWSAASGIPGAISNVAECAAALNGSIVGMFGDIDDNAYSYISTDSGATWSQLKAYGSSNWWIAIAAGTVGGLDTFVAVSDFGDWATVALQGSSEPAAVVDSSQPITSLEPSLRFFAEVSGQAQSQNVIFLKNRKEAWTYDGTTLTKVTDADYPGWSVVTPTSITRSGAVATITLPAAVNWQSGSSVTVAGCDQAEYNGTHVINVTDATHCTFPVTGTPATPATGTITATGGRTTVPGVVYLDGYFFVMDEDGTIYNSGLGDATAWGALDFITANIEPGSGIAIAKSQNYVIALKAWSTEFFYDAGNATGSPLSPVLSAFTLVGCASGDSVANIDGTVAWVSKTRQKGRAVHLMNGLTQTKVSTPDIERILNADTLANVYSYGVKISGHTFYVLGLKASNITLVYDLTSGLWTPWTSLTARTAKACTIVSDGGVATATCADHGLSDGDPAKIAGAAQAEYNGDVQVRVIDANTFRYAIEGAPASPATGSITATGYDETYFKFTKYAYCSGRDLVLHETSGELFEITESQYSDGPAPINFMCRTGKIDGDSIERKTNSQLKVIGNKSGGIAMVRWSDDDYTTNGAFRPVNLSSEQARLSRLGSFRRRSYELRHVGNAPVQVAALELEIQQEK